MTILPALSTTVWRIWRTLYFFFFIFFPCSCLYKFLQILTVNLLLLGFVFPLFPSSKNYIFSASCECYSLDLWDHFCFSSLASFQLFTTILVCCVTVRRAFQPKPLSRLGGLLRLPHTSCKIQFFAFIWPKLF